MSIYRGFNTIGKDFGPYKLRDNSLVIRDLLNHLYIKKGEKIHNAEFGTIIWASLFEPLTPALKEAIRKDIEQVAKYDPRIRLIDRVIVQEYENGLRIDLQVTFSLNNEVANLALQFDKQKQNISIIG